MNKFSESGETMYSFFASFNDVHTFLDLTQKLDFTFKFY